MKKIYLILIALVLFILSCGVEGVKNDHYRINVKEQPRATSTPCVIYVD